MDVSLDRASFRARAERSPLVALSAEVVADCDTPVSAYARLAEHVPYSYLLESVAGGDRWARQSIIGIGAQAVLRVRGASASLRWLHGERAMEVERFTARDALEALDSVLERLGPPEPPGSGAAGPFEGGAVGVLSYDAARRFDGVKIPERLAADGTGDDAVFALSDRVVIFDNRRHRARLVKTVFTPDGARRGAAALDALYDQAVAELAELAASFALEAPRAARQVARAAEAPTLVALPGRDDYLAAVRAAKEHLVAGDAIQVVLSQRFTCAASAGPTPLEVYRALRQDNPSPYLYLLSFPGEEVVGASPEVLCRVEDGHVTVRPLAGTRRRGADDAEDARLAEELLADPKERAEHVMLLDLGRNDVGRVARAGSVAVPERMQVERYSHVMHLVSTVTGTLAPGLRPVDALRAAFPAGTLTGAPKVRAMQIIEELETVRRGPYGGAVGYVAFGGRALDAAICIRTLWRQGGHWTGQAGAGIVLGSDPEREHDECLAKSAALAAALRRATAGVR